MTFPFPFIVPGAAAAAASGFGALVTMASDLTAQNYTAPRILSFDTETYDDGGWHDNVTNNSRLTVPSGVTKVRIAAQVSGTGINADVAKSIEIYKNGAAMSPQVYLMDSHISGAPSDRVQSYVADVTAGDYFEVRYLLGSDVSTNIIAAQTWFAIETVE